MITNNKPFLNIIFLYRSFSFIRKAKDLPAKYCQKYKEQLKKCARKRHQDHSENKKTKIKNVVNNNVKTFLRMKDSG